jgi:hypothetical protein
MRVNSQPALEITRALSKLINRNLMLVAPPAQSEATVEDKENAPWVPIESFKVCFRVLLIIERFRKKKELQILLQDL